MGAIPFALKGPDSISRVMIARPVVMSLWAVPLRGYLVARCGAWSPGAYNPQRSKKRGIFNDVEERPWADVVHGWFVGV